MSNQSYEIDIQSLSENIISAEYIHVLDQPGVLSVDCIIDPKNVKQTSADNIPKECKLKMKGNIIFTGHITEFNVLSRNKIRLIFKDIVHLLKNYNCEFYKKETTLQEVITEALKTSGFKMKTYGDFSRSLESFNVNSKNLLSLMQELSTSNAFHFKADSKNETIELIKIGGKIGSSDIDCSQDLNILKSGHGSEDHLKEITYLHLDVSNLQKNKESIDADSMGTQFKELATSSSYKSRLNWKSSEGKMSFSMPNKRLFTESKDTFLGKCLKNAVDQETIFIESFDISPSPGHIIKVKNSTSPLLQDGSFLVNSLNIEFKSKTPRIVLGGIRP
jgi:hypothetical protein